MKITKFEMKYVDFLKLKLMPEILSLNYVPEKDTRHYRTTENFKLILYFLQSFL